MLKPNYKNFTELESHASKQLHNAIETGQDEIKIILYDNFPNNVEKIKDVCGKYDIKEITEKFRAQFTAYNIKSIVGVEVKFAIITFEKGPCANMSQYPLVWTLSLTKK